MRVREVLEPRGRPRIFERGNNECQDHTGQRDQFPNKPFLDGRNNGSDKNYRQDPIEPIPCTHGTLCGLLFFPCRAAEYRTPTDSAAKGKRRTSQSVPSVEIVA